MVKVPATCTCIPVQGEILGDGLAVHLPPSLLPRHSHSHSQMACSRVPMVSRYSAEEHTKVSCYRYETTIIRIDRPDYMYMYM